jgi:hypothetical protein
MIHYEQAVFSGSLLFLTWFEPIVVILPDNFILNGKKREK